MQIWKIQIFPIWLTLRYNIVLVYHSDRWTGIKENLDLGMARGIPRPLRSRTFFHSLITRGIDSIIPRILESSPRGPQKGLDTFQNFLLLAVRDKFYYWNINVHLKVSYILFWIFVILLWKTFNCPYWVAEWNDKPIAP